MGAGPADRPTTPAHVPNIDRRSGTDSRLTTGGPAGGIVGPIPSSAARSRQRVVTDTDIVRDGWTRGLSVVVRLLRPARQEWGAAMQAELAVIESSSARRRYALGCAR